MPVKPASVQSVSSRSAAPAMSKERKAFWQSPFTNEDAKVVKTKMKLPSLDAAKEVIGKAVLEKNEGSLQGMGVSRHLFDDQDCVSRFKRSSFSSADVAQAKKSFDFLKGASTAQVQSYLGLKLRNAESGYKGGMEMMAAHGITESKYDSHDQMAAFKTSGMTDRHVREAKAKFDFLANSPVAEIKQYLGLKVLNAKDGYAPAKAMLKDVGFSKGWGS
jgi:hypothetical protein